MTYTYETAALPLKIQILRPDGLGRTAASWCYFDGACHPGLLTPRVRAPWPRDLVSKAQRFDGNGRLLEQALPYYSSSDAYAPPDAGVAPVRMSYDALGRTARAVPARRRRADRTPTPEGSSRSRARCPAGRR